MTSTQTPRTDPSNRTFLLVVVGLVILGLAAVALVAGSGGGDDGAIDDGAAQTATVSVDGDGLAQLPEGVRVGTPETDPVVGTTAPALTGTAFDGSEVRVTADGRPKVVYFLAHWCPHCQDEVPVIQELIDGGRQPEGIDIYAVSTAVDAGSGNFPPQDWLADEGFTPSVIRDDDNSSAYRAFGGSGFPYAVYLDGEGRVIARSAGSVDADTMATFWDLTLNG